MIINIYTYHFYRLFSPSRCNADDVFKIEFLNEIKDNLNLTTVTCKKLQRLLLSESALEVSDFPSPSILENYRKSAPPRLINKKIKSRQLFDKDNFFKVANDPKNKENQILPNNQKENENRTQKLNNVIRNIIDSSDDGDDRNVPRNVMGNIDKNIHTAKSSGRPNDADKRKLLSIKKTKKTKNLQDCQAKANAEKQRYSSVYDLKLDSRESSNLFVTGRSHKKSSKPTIVCTYFSQM